MDRETLRADMVEGVEHALNRSLDSGLLDALSTVPRHEFVEEAYANREQAVAGSRALRPETVARLVDALEPTAGTETLIVGAGVGYTAAVLAELVGDRHVQAIDIDRHLVHIARENLSSAGYGGVLVDRRDGARGYPEYAPFDRILVESAVVSLPRALREQLAPEGRIVFPRGTTDQTLVAVESDPESAGATLGAPETFGPVTFRPMLVDGEQPSGHERNRTRREDAEFDEGGYFAPTGWEYEWLDWEERLSGSR